MTISSMDGGTSSVDESVIGGCHPWMKMTDDGHGRSNSVYTRNIQSVDTFLPKLPTDALAQQLYNANQVKSIM